MVPYSAVPVIFILAAFCSELGPCKASETWNCPNITKPEDRGSLSCREANGEFVFWCSNSTILSPEIYESFESEEVVILPGRWENISVPACLDESEGKTVHVWGAGLDNGTDCGRRRSELEMSSCVNSKIVGGCTVEPQELPWLCGLLHDGEMVCGATLLQQDPHVLVTAAHCVDQAKTMELVCGGHLLTQNKTFKDGLRLKILKTVMHEDYNWHTYQNDIALLFVEQFHSKTVSSICLPTPGYTYEGWQNSYVSGWGVKNYGGSLELGPPLKVKHVPVGSDECDRMNDPDQMIFHGMMCVGGESGQDACQGDSGGALMASLDGGRWSLIGVVSWGKRCGLEGRYGVYTRLTDYLDWIGDKISAFIEEGIEENETSSKFPKDLSDCKIQFWCDFTSGEDPTIVIILSILVCLILVFFLFLLVRMSANKSSEEEKKHMFMRTETELDAFGEENEFTFLAGPKPDRNSISPNRRSIKPKVHRIIDLEEERLSNEGAYIPNMQTFNSIRSNQSIRTQGSFGTKTLGSEAGYSSSTIKSFLLRTKTQSSINSNPASTSSKRKTLKLKLTDSEKVDIVVSEGDSFESVDERIESNEADMDIGGMFEGMLEKDASDGGREVLHDMPEISHYNHVLNTRISMSVDASPDFLASPKLARNTSLTASMRMGDYYKTSLDEHLY